MRRYMKPVASENDCEKGADSAVSPSRGERLLQLTSVLLAAAALVWLGCLVAGQKVPGGGWTLQAMVAGGVVLAGGWGSAWCHRHWRRPLERFLQLLPKIQAAEAPIEALSEIVGGPR